MGTFSGQAGAAALTAVPTLTKVGSMTLARLSYLMMESAEAKGVEIEFDESRVDNTFAFFTAINLVANIWTANELLRIQPQWAAASLQLYREAKLLDEGGDVLAAQLKRKEARVAAQKAGSVIGRGIGKVFLIDGLIWAATGGIDVALNVLGIPEEEQGFFADVYGGWSPIGYVIEQVIGILLETAGIEPEDLWIELLEVVKDSPTLEAAIIAGMNFYIERIGGEININSYELSRAMNTAAFTEWVNVLDEDPLSVIMVFAESIIVLLMLGLVATSIVKVIKKAMGGQ